MNIIKEPNFENLGKVVSLFFVADGKLLFHGCSIEEAPVSSSFITYPESHQEVWEREHREQYNVAYDYYPRGRILYDKKADILMVFTDPCVIDIAEKFAEAYKDGFRWVFTDEQYHCPVRCPPFGVRSCFGTKEKTPDGVIFRRAQSAIC